MKVYQEDELETRTVIDKDGIVILPLVGPAKVGERTPDEATAFIRGLYAKDYLIDPQVSVVVIEHAKRHFTVMGQVQRPGTYEMPVTKPLNLLQAIATAGGYTRLAARSRITVQRMKKGQPVAFSLNADSMSKDNKSKA
ncbi:MAG: SLBB domain-containing protein, partial [Chloroflexi bacterium]|nr:SLBB domain-containing protein [Chloroflexota bacterium]